MRAPSALLILFLLVALPPGALSGVGGGALAGGDPSALILQVYANAPRGDEFVALGNPGAVAVDLSGWSITDGEGIATFPDDSPLEPGAVVYATANGTAFAQDLLREPEYTYGAGPGRPMAVKGRLQLANAGDEVILRDAAGVTVDAFVYGGGVRAVEGWIGPPSPARDAWRLALRRGPFMDNDTAEDWTERRPYTIGQSSWPWRGFTVEGPLVAFASPDNGLGVLVEALGRARERVTVNAYQWNSAALTDALEAALGRGVAVEVFVEGGKVGGPSEGEVSLIHRLVALGADVRVMGGTSNDVGRRYRLNHAKYIVVDGTWTFVTSENFSDFGFPPEGRAGNRGWGVLIQDRSLAQHLGEVLRQDWGLAWRDVHTLEEVGMAAGENWTTRVPPPYAGATGPLERPGGATVWPLLGPDHTLEDYGLLALLASARNSIEAQVYYARLEWGGGLNPYLEALKEAAARGVRVRLILDAGSEGGDPGSDNRRVAAHLEAEARSRGLPMEVRLAEGGPWSKVHNKGLVVDGRWSLVGSLNWAFAGAALNREVSIIVEDASIAGYFTSLFQSDWAFLGAPLTVDLGPDRTLVVGETALLTASPSATAVHFRWTVQGRPSAATGPQHPVSFDRPGIYAVAVTVTDGQGRRATDEINITVQPPDGFPTASLPILAAASPAPPVGFLLWRWLRTRREGRSKPPRMVDRGRRGRHLRRRLGEVRLLSPQLVAGPPGGEGRPGRPGGGPEGAPPGGGEAGGDPGGGAEGKGG